MESLSIILRKLQFRLVRSLPAKEEVKKSASLLSGLRSARLNQIVSESRLTIPQRKWLAKGYGRYKPETCKLAGILSGMILCAEDADGNLSLMVPEDAAGAGSAKYEIESFDKSGNAVMVDVSDKPVTHRTATATSSIQNGPEIMAAVKSGNVKR